jgi:DMSO/TMAO reductase YedYZ heme-binding membrane subunit
MFSPILNSKNESALQPIFSDSTKNQESEKHGDLLIASKKKTQRLAPIVSDTVPEVKKKEQELPNTIELKDQLQQDKRNVRFSWLSLFLSLVVFIVGFAIWWQTESSLSGALLSFGFLGLIASLILIITFTILKNKRKNQIKLNQKRHELAINPSNQVNHKSKKEIDARLAEIDQSLKKLKIVRIIFGISSILTFSILFPIGILSFVVFLIATGRRNRLKEERYLLPYQEG